MDIIPLFKSHYSLGRSILTLASEPEPNGPDSIPQIAQENSLKEVYLVDDSMGGFLEAYSSLAKFKIKLIFGVRITVCQDLHKKNEASIQTSCKYIIFCKNKNGYKRLIKIYSQAAIEGFYYESRTDFESIKNNWSDKDLLLAVPFYDSFIFQNNFSSRGCVPDFSFCKPVLFVENNNLPYDHILKDLVEDYASASKYEKVNTQSVFYKNKEDFKAYSTFRCINNRSTLEKPQLNNMSSDTFCFENWTNQGQEAVNK